MEQDIFAVDLTLSIETHDKVHLPTQVIGWKKDSFLLTDAIYVQGQPVNLKNKDVCTIRFLRDGVAYGFQSVVLTVQYFPFPLMFFSYPGKIACVKLRVAPRFKIELPIAMTDASGSTVSDAMMLDISEGGCRLRIPVTPGKDVQPDANYTVRFKIIDKELSSSCTIRSIEQQKDVSFVGMEFTAMTGQNKEALALFLDFLKMHVNV